MIIHPDTKKTRTSITRDSQWTQLVVNRFSAKDGAGRGAESSSIGTGNLTGLRLTHRLCETQGYGTKREKCLGEPLAGTD